MFHDVLGCAYAIARLERRVGVRGVPNSLLSSIGQRRQEVVQHLSFLLFHKSRRWEDCCLTQRILAAVALRIKSLGRYAPLI